jgi:Txe/YoeB family toxin of Txe-Axe toxin-antitoxin module
MPKIAELRPDLHEYLAAHCLVKKWQKAKALFENNPFHASLNTELLEPKHRAIYSFRLDKRYRALFINLGGGVIEVFAITMHYRKS